MNSEGDAIKVFLRVRPPENANSALPFNGRVVDVNASNNSVTLLAKPDPKVFTFDHVADTNSTQVILKLHNSQNCTFLSFYVCVFVSI